MKKWTVPAVVVGVLVLFALMIGGLYNGLVGQRESVTKAFSDVKVQYQRRADLIPNLVNTVKGSSEFEQSTLTQVTEARAKANGINVNAENPQQVQEYINAQGQVSSSLGRLIATVESYPDIKSTAAYRDLLTQLEGTENRIAVARSDFNKAAQPYNARVQTFPTNVFAGMFGFTKFPYFEADAGSDKAPTVDFNKAQ